MYELKKILLFLGCGILAVCCVCTLASYGLVSFINTRSAAYELPDSELVPNAAEDTRGFKFRNLERFSLIVVKSTALQECPVPGDTVDETVYSIMPDLGSAISEFNSEDKEAPLYFYVFRNAAIHAGNSAKLAESYNKVKNILEEKPTTKEIKLSSTKEVWDMFAYNCAGNPDLRIDYIEKINYPGTDSAYLLISHGSSQSTYDEGYLPVQISLLARKGDDYGMVALHYGKYNDITLRNQLAQCALKDESRDGTSSCFGEFLVKDLDKTKLEKIKANLLELFAITI